MQVKVVDHFLIKKLRGNIFAHDFEFSDNLLFDSDAGLIIKFGVLFDEKFLIFLMTQVRGHFGNELN